MDVDEQRPSLEEQINSQIEAARHSDPRLDTMMEIAPGVLKRLGDCTPSEMIAATKLIDERVRRGEL